MSFADFARACGLIVSDVTPGRWVRVPTVDHPRTKNGAYKWLGNIGWCQNHATMIDVATWRADESDKTVDMAAINCQSEEFDAKKRAGWVRAAARAAELVRDAKPAEHPYMHIKGFADRRELVSGESLVVPMRHWRSNSLVGAQLIQWDAEERKYTKKMLPGMRAKGAVFRIGSPQAPRLWLVEGYATGLSVEAALRLLCLRDAVVVCFSASNLVHVAKQLGGDCIVFADNDQSGAGERAAVETGLPYRMSSFVGDDANDMHKRDGIFALADVLMGAVSAMTG